MSGLEISVKNLSLNDRSKTVKRPPNAFILYSCVERGKLKKIHPLLTNKRISTLLGNQWSKLDSKIKDIYFKKAAEIVAEHMKQNPGYVYSPKEARISKMMRQLERREKCMQRAFDKCKNFGAKKNPIRSSKVTKSIDESVNDSQNPSINNHLSDSTLHGTSCDFVSDDHSSSSSDFASNKNSSSDSALNQNSSASSDSGNDNNSDSPSAILTTDVAPDFKNLEMLADIAAQIPNRDLDHSYSQISDAGSSLPTVSNSYPYAMSYNSGSFATNSNNFRYIPNSFYWYGPQYSGQVSNSGSLETGQQMPNSTDGNSNIQVSPMSSRPVPSPLMPSSSCFVPIPHISRFYPLSDSSSVFPLYPYFCSPPPHFLNPSFSTSGYDINQSYAFRSCIPLYYSYPYHPCLPNNLLGQSTPPEVSYPSYENSVSIVTDNEGNNEPVVPEDILDVGNA